MAARPRRALASRRCHRVELGVDQRVDAAQEEARDRRDLIDGLARLHSLFETGQIRIDDVPVAIDAEQQRDIDVDSGRDQLGDRRQARLGARHLDHGVGTIERLPQPQTFLDGALGVVGQVR